MIIPLNTAISASQLDNDALAFIEEASITDSFTIRALNELCRDLKREGIWDSLYVAFPMIFTGVTASQLIDLKTRTQLEIVTPSSGSTASPTYSSDGIKYNGGQYHLWVDGFFNPSPFSDTPPSHIAIYSRTNHLSEGITQSTHGYYEFSNGNHQLISFSTSSVVASLWNSTYSVATFSNTNSTGFYIFSNSDNNSGFTASSQYPYQFYMSRNGQVIGTSSSTKNKQANGSRVVVGGFSWAYGELFDRAYDQICWYSCGAGFSGSNSQGGFIPESKQEIFYNIIQKFQTYLGREV